MDNPLKIDFRDVDLSEKSSFPIENFYDCSEWEVTLTKDRDTVIITDLLADPLGEYPNSYRHTAVGADSFVGIIHQIADSREFVICDYTKNYTLSEVSIVHLHSNGTVEYLLQESPKKCYWIVKNSLLYIEPRCYKSRYYSVPLHAEIGRYIYDALGYRADFELVRDVTHVLRQGYTNSIRVLINERVVAAFDYRNMSPESKAYSILRKKLFPIVSFSSYAAIVKEDIEDVKKAESFVSRITDGHGSNWNDAVPKVIEELEPMLLERAGAPKTDFHFGRLFATADVYQLDMNKYFIDRTEDSVVVRSLDNDSFVVIRGEGVCTGLIQGETMHGKDYFLIAFKCVEKSSEGQPPKDEIWLHRYEVWYDKETWSLKYAHTGLAGEPLRYLLRNVNCQLSADLICIGCRIYSISRDVFVSDVMERYFKGSNVYCREDSLRRQLAVEINGKPVPALILALGCWENSVYTIVRLDTLEVVGGVAYNMLAQSFMKVSSVEDCIRIAEENIRLVDVAFNMLSTIEP